MGANKVRKHWKLKKARKARKARRVYRRANMMSIPRKLKIRKAIRINVLACPHCGSYLKV